MVARSGELAEVLTKALLVLDPHESFTLVESLPDVEALVVDDGGVRHASTGFRDFFRSY